MTTQPPATPSCPDARRGQVSGRKFSEHTSKAQPLVSEDLKGFTPPFPRPPASSMASKRMDAVSGEDHLS